jgi:outer membrane protein
LEKAEQNDFDVVLQTLALDVAEREISKAKAEFLPTAELVGNYSKGKAIFAPGLEINNSSVRQGSNSVGLTISVPLFGGLASTGRVSQARHLARQASAELARARHAARLAASRAFLSGRTGVDQIAAGRDMLQSAQLAFDAVNKGFEYGKKSLTDVGLAADKLFQAQRDQARLQYDFYISYLTLLSSTGALDDAALIALSDRKAPTAGALPSSPIARQAPRPDEANHERAL